MHRYTRTPKQVMDAPNRPHGIATKEEGNWDIYSQKRYIATITVKFPTLETKYCVYSCAGSNAL